jgi:hypothetical protein
LHSYAWNIARVCHKPVAAESLSGDMAASADYHNTAIIAVYWDQV